MNRPLRAAALLATVSVLGVAVYSDFPLCPMASSFGIPCPGCGLTRATLALLHGDVHSALRFHPLVFLLTPLFVGFVGSAVLELFRDPARPRRPSRVQWNGRAISLAATLLLVLTLGVWLARFAGYFGGPVPVVSLRAWLAQKAAAR